MRKPVEALYRAPRNPVIVRLYWCARSPAVDGSWHGRTAHGGAKTLCTELSRRVRGGARHPDGRRTTVDHSLQTARVCAQSTDSVPARRPRHTDTRPRRLWSPRALHFGVLFRRIKYTINKRNTHARRLRAIILGFSLKRTISQHVTLTEVAASDGLGPGRA